MWVMSSSLPQLIGNYITHNRMYGLAVFCRKDAESTVSRDGYRERGVVGERDRGGPENFNEEGELMAWESDIDSEEERFSSRRPITVALVENNCMSHNGGLLVFDFHLMSPSELVSGLYTVNRFLNFENLPEPNPVETLRVLICVTFHLKPCLCSSCVSSVVGVYVKSSEPLNVVANMVNNNRGAGVSIIQSAQLTRLVGNCMLGNGWMGVTVDRECRVELRGNGVYSNGCHGVCFRGDGLIVENDVVGNNSVGIRVMDNTDVKVCYRFSFTK